MGHNRAGDIRKKRLKRAKKAALFQAAKLAEQAAPESAKGPKKSSK